MTTNVRTEAFSHNAKPYFATARLQGECWLIKIYDENDTCLSSVGLPIAQESVQDARSQSMFDDLLQECINQHIDDFKNGCGEFQRD